MWGNSSLPWKRRGRSWWPSEISASWAPSAPGGALEALAARHPGHVWTLTDNLRQRDPAERLALDHLRAGNLPAAVNWYVAQGRVHPARNSAHAMLEMIRAWAYDVAAGRDALLVAYHRDAVEILNRAAREVWEKLGQLSGPELEAPGGRRYRAGDRVITLSPGPRGAWVNSQRAVVKSVDLHQCSLVAVTPEGTELHMGPKDIGADQLGYSFALTAHRAQGATVDATYALADGGGRELAYVAMSRARHESHVHVVAPNPAEAAQRVAWAWGHERRQRWVLDQDRRRQLANLYIERQDLRASVPPDRSADLGQARRQLANAEQDAADLRTGTGRWAYSPAAYAARALHQAEAEHQRAAQALEVDLRPLGEAQGPSPAARSIGLPGYRAERMGPHRPALRRPARDGPGPARHESRSARGGPACPRHFHVRTPRGPSAA